MDKSCFVNPIHQFLLLLFLSFLFFLSSYYGCVASAISTIGSSNNMHTMCIEHERVALLKFKRGIHFDRCGLLSSWDDHEDNRNCCEWHGVGCSNITGHVIKLDLRGNESVDGYPDEQCLQGIVSSSLVELKHLRHLDLSCNYLSSRSIPSFIGSLVNLKYLNFSHSSFVGEIPEQLGNLSSLTSLDLSHNYGDLYVKNLSWLSRLTMLKTITLGAVNLSEATNWLQIVNSLPFLKVVDLYECDLPRPVIVSPLSYQNSSSTLSFLHLAGNGLNDPSLLFEWLFNLSGINAHLTHLDLSYNQLEGHLPNALGDLHAISLLDLSHNKFQGNIPNSFGNMQSLSYLDLSNNTFEGNIPDSFGNMQSLSYLNMDGNRLQTSSKILSNLCNLQELHLSDNNITDELSNLIQPLTGCAFKSLLHLDLSFNNIWGPIPDLPIGYFPSLRTLNLNHNQLNGTISESLGQMSRMETLDLSYNCFKGTLSDIHFSNLSSLKSLYLSDNCGLAFNMSVDWVPPFQLDDIELSSCKLGPLFPKWLLSQTNYSSLDISNAEISDTIPKSFWKTLHSKLSLLNLSHNNISGTLPNLSEFQFSSGQEIDMSFNNMEGVIPSIPINTTVLLLNDNRFSNSTPLLCPKAKKTTLSNLDLSNNYLSGELPNCWIRFPRLSILHLENNNFSGVVPPSISNLNNLESLQLRNNSISGGLSGSLEKLTSLIILDLGYNSLSGHIPPSIGHKLRSLSILSLQSNRIDGKLPLSLCQMSFLQILDLSSNHIKGPVPKCIHKLKAMQTEAEVMPPLQYIYSEDSATEVVSGFEDAVIISWKRKEWNFQHTLGLVKVFDISNNQLEGEIPTEFSYLKGLGSLNLSRNNLSGALPSNLGQLTALQILDLSRNQLFGGIPSSFAELNSLGILDLSNNQFSGEIPNIPQLQRFDESSYIGNPRLCGLPLPKCPWDQANDNNTSTEDNANHQDENDSDDDVFKVGLYISVVLGFIIGFWGVCGTLVLKKPWRQAFFKFLDNMRDKLNGMVSVNVARLRRRN